MRYDDPQNLETGRAWLRAKGGYGVRMHVLLVGRGGHNEGTVVAKWDDPTGTLVVRWDASTRETPVADILRPWCAEGDEAACVATKPIELIPDFTDPATKGVALDIVRKAWQMPTGLVVAYVQDEGLWYVTWSGSTHGGICGVGATEGAALVNAMENVP